MIKELNPVTIDLYRPEYRQDFIRLYRKLGFREIPLESNAYERCDILMELVL